MIYHRVHNCNSRQATGFSSKIKIRAASRLDCGTLFSVFGFICKDQKRLKCDSFIGVMLMIFEFELIIFSFKRLPPYGTDDKNLILLRSTSQKGNSPLLAMQNFVEHGQRKEKTLICALNLDVLFSTNGADRVCLQRRLICSQGKCFAD